ISKSYESIPGGNTAVRILHIPNCRPKRYDIRRGAILVLSALLLIVMFAIAAFSIDLGYIEFARTQLQNTADASALAGAQALTDSTSTALAAAKTVASAN